MNRYIPILMIVVSSVLYQVCSKSVPQGVNPFASLTVTYLVGACAAAILYAVFSKGGNLLQECHNLNWSSFALGIMIIGLEAGSIYMYRLGWNVSTGQLVCSALLAVSLIFVGYLFYQEAITGNKIAGILICMAGLYFINK